MERGLTGYYISLPSGGAERARAFVPHPLPPKPAIDVSGELQQLISDAATALGRLEGVANSLPNPNLLLYSYVRKEAVLSSQIEGTQSSLDDLLTYENDIAPGVPLDDVEEVSNYVAAMNYGLKRLKQLPFSLRLMKEIHGVLMLKGRGSRKEPGEFRRSQNWVGGSRPGNAVFVPPPADRVIECLGALENFVHEARLPVLMKAALAHVQFETIHPFLDGNGRVGRLLVTLLLCAEGALRQPLLYLSLYFKQNRQRYYELLQKVRLFGDWEAWVGFFMSGVAQTAAEAADSAMALTNQAAADEKRIHGLGKAARSAFRVHQLLRARPLLSIASASKDLNLTIPTVTAAFRHLAKLGIVRETTGGKYRRLYAYSRYLRILNVGVEPVRSARTSE